MAQGDDLFVGDVEGDVLQCYPGQVVHLLLNSDLVAFKRYRRCGKVGGGISSSLEFNFFSVVAICSECNTFTVLNIKLNDIKKELTKISFGKCFGFN